MRKLSYKETLRRDFLLRNQNLIGVLYPELKIYGPYLSKDGRYRVVFSNGSTKVTRQYAKVKMEIKLERRLAANETVDHKNENKKDDRYSNLQLLTRRENVVKSHKAGTLSSEAIVKFSKTATERKRRRVRVLGEKNPFARFTDADVMKLRSSFKSGKLSINEIVHTFKVTKRCVTNMLYGVSYSHLANASRSPRS